MRKLLTLLVAVMGAVAIGVVPAGAITNGVPDDGAHPQVGELLFYVPDAVDPRFTDPGGWFTCSGTLLSPTVLLTAGHCADGVGLNGVATTPTGGDGGNDVWVNFEDEPDFSILPPSSGFIPDNNAGRYAAWSAALNASAEWNRGTAQAHPDYNPAAFFLFDAGIIVLADPVGGVSEFGELTEEGTLDSKEAKKELYTPVGYGLNASGPQPAQQLGGDVRFKATMKLVNVDGTFGIPQGTSAKFSSNNGQPHQGGTCFGDSGGPIFREGTLEIVAVTSFGISTTCSGTSGGYRVDQADDLEFIGSFLD